MSPAATQRHTWMRLATVVLVLVALTASTVQVQPTASAADTLAAHPLAAGGVTYTYDAAGRLARADYAGGKSIIYTYDNAGNLLRRETLLTPSVTFPDGGTGGNVVLSWTHDPLYAGYQVWYSTQPYFTPGDNCLPPPADPSCTCVTAPGHTFTHTGAAADVVNNYTYLVLGVTGSGSRSSGAGRVGEFGFGLTAGTP